MWFCRLELARYVEGGQPSVAHPSSAWRWIIRQIPYSMAGNTEKRDLVGADLVGIPTSKAR